MENLPTSIDPIILNDDSFKFNSSHKKRIFLVIIIFFVSLVIYYLLFSAPRNFPANTIISIKEGSSLRYVSRYLKDNNIIRSRVVFETFVIMFGNEKYVALGDYFFEDKLSVFEVAKRISKGERHLAPIKVTIPEGFTNVDISEAFASKLSNFNIDKFKIEAKEKEGYLFPDTYFFLTTDNEKDVLNSMSSNFDKKMSVVRTSILSSGKEVITMASIIEKESKGDTDRAFISGILWKRLSIGMALQVDADPNTYKVKGLPIKPISNPGMEAIEAAIYPKYSSYLYYLHDKEGNIHYARNFKEHQNNIIKYLK
jgi:UPF0755 protein